MMLFWIISAAMILAALVLLAPSLLRRQSLDNLDRDQQNVVIARERLAELKVEHEQGILTDGQYQQSRAELEQSLVLDLEQQVESGRNSGDSAAAGRLAMASIALLVPALTLGLYAYLGSPGLVGPQQQVTASHASSGDRDMPSVEEMMQTLAQRLKENPEDTEGWFLLGRSYMAVQDYQRAAKAFERLHQMVGDEPAVLLSWADSLAMTQGGSISGKPAELVKKAVVLVPEDSTALWLAGIVAEQEGDYDLALAYWTRLQPKLAGDEASQQKVAQLIAGARQKAGQAAGEPPVERSATVAAEKGSNAVVEQAGDSAPGVRVRVDLSIEMAALAEADDLLFVYAKAVQGPPMPLAAVRLQAKDLPLEVTLDDAKAMMPAMRISNFEQVTVGARISKSGNPTAGSGDLSGEVSPVAVTGAGLVEILIDRQLP